MYLALVSVLGSRSRASLLWQIGRMRLITHVWKSKPLRHRFSSHSLSYLSVFFLHEFFRVQITVYNCGERCISIRQQQQKMMNKYVRKCCLLFYGIAISSRGKSFSVRMTKNVFATSFKDIRVCILLAESNHPTFSQSCNFHTECHDMQWIYLTISSLFRHQQTAKISLPFGGRKENMPNQMKRKRNISRTFRLPSRILCSPHIVC